MWVDGGADYVAVDPPCCGWDRLQQRRLGTTTKTVCSGETVHGEQGFYGRNELLIPSGGFGCQCTPERQAAIQRYEWTPLECSLPAWDAAAFCKALGNRTMLWIGDSTGGQLAAGVHNYVSWSGGGCAHQFTHEISDTLNGNDYGVLNRGKRWVDHVKSTTPRRPDIVIVNAGAHIKNMVPGGTSALLQVLSTTREEFLSGSWHTEGETHPMHLVWRTSLGAGCLVEGDVIAPLPAQPRDMPGWWEHVNATQKLYNFKLMYEWDSIAIEFWKHVPGASILDLTPLWQRPDSMQGSGQHEPWNCIHLCSPGPLRVSVSLSLLPMPANSQSKTLNANGNLTPTPFLPPTPTQIACCTPNVTLTAN